MTVQFVSKGIDVSPALRERTTEKVGDILEKYFNRPSETFLTVARDGHRFKVECSLHLPSGALLNASGEGDEAYGAVEAALTRLEKRLRRYKRKLKDKRNGQKDELTQAALTVLRSTPSRAQDDDEAEDDDDQIAHGEAEPVVVAETTAELRTLTVGMAVWELDLADAPVLVFRNAAHGGVNVVYRRPDGHIGWMDPERPGADAEG